MPRRALGHRPHHGALAVGRTEHGELGLVEVRQPGDDLVQRESGLAKHPSDHARREHAVVGREEVAEDEAAAHRAGEHGVAVEHRLRERSARATRPNDAAARSARRSRRPPATRPSGTAIAPSSASRVRHHSSMTACIAVSPSSRTPLVSQQADPLGAPVEHDADVGAEQLDRPGTARRMLSPVGTSDGAEVASESTTPLTRDRDSGSSRARPAAG